MAKGMTLSCWKDFLDQALVFLQVPRHIIPLINFSSFVLKAVTAFFFFFSPSFAAEFQAHAKVSASFLGHRSALSFPPLTLKLAGLF